MEEIELANILRKMYSNAPKGEQAAMIHLFGIKYNQELEQVSIKEVVTLSGLAPSYQVEVNKGTNLAKYVNIKQEYK